jgi:hypothetical protein
MGFRGQFAQQQSCPAHVRFGSKADIADCEANVRFTPKSGHSSAQLACPVEDLSSPERYWSGFAVWPEVVVIALRSHFEMRLPLSLET